MRDAVRRARLATAGAVLTLLPASLTSLVAPVATAGTFPGVNGRVAFSSGVDGDAELYVVNSDGTNRVKLTDNATADTDAGWSPDQTSLAYVAWGPADSSGYSESQIHTIPVTGGPPRQVTQAPPGVHPKRPSWSPDGTRIAYEAWDGSDREIYTIPATGGTPVQVTSDALDTICPQWSPDGRSFAFFGRIPGVSQGIYTVPATGGSPTLVTSGGPTGCPQWSPDSSTLVFDYRPGVDDSEIYTVPAAGGTPTQVTYDDQWDIEPSFSPDGTKLIFLGHYGIWDSTTYGAYNLVTVPVSGGPKTQFTETMYGFGAPAWGSAPDIQPPPPPPDTAPPTATLGSQPAFQLASTQTVRWTAGDTGGSGIARFQMRYRRAPWNGGFGGWVYPTGWQSLGSSGRWLSAAIPDGATDCFSIRAFDKAGNVGAWSAQRCTARPLDDRALAASAGWANTTGAGLYRGTLRSTSTYGKSLLRTGVYARQLALVTTTCPSCGLVRVSIGGVKVATISLYSSDRRTMQVRILPPFTYRTGTVTVTAISSGKPLPIDALGVTK